MQLIIQRSDIDALPTSPPASINPPWLRAGEHATQCHPSELMLIFGMVALMYFIYCYPVLRLAKWAEDKMGRVEIEH